MTVALGVVTEVLLSGLMVAGDFEGEFEQWEGQPSDWVARIYEALTSVEPRDLYPGYGGWLSITDAGRAHLAEWVEAS